MAAGWALPAHAGVLSLAMPETLASPGGMDDPGIAFADLADLDLAAQSAQDGFEQAFNAALTSNILQSLGIATRLAGDVPKARVPSLRDAFTAKMPQTTRPDPSFASLINPKIGSRETVAISVADKFVTEDKQTTGINTDVQISHKAGAVDAAFNLAGHQNFNVADPMAVSYDGHALVAVGPVVQLGVTAHGTMGTTSALTMAGSPQAAGPLVHLNMIDSKVSLSSDVGYDFGLNTPVNATPLRPQVHVKMALKLKL